MTAGTTGLFPGLLAENELRQPYSQPLLSDATRAGEEKNLGQTVVGNRTGKTPTNLVMPHQRVQSH
jgi:hypothetical protein